MKKTRIFLTGGSGYIGKNIVEQLENIYDLIYPLHSQLELLNSEDVEKFFKAKGPFDVVIHCAFIGGSRKDIDTPETLKENLRIYFNIARNKDYFGKLINLGSGAEYGKQRPLVRIKEGDFDKVVPSETDYYGYAKYIIGKYTETSDKMVNLRLFGVYGKYEDTTIRFISNAICKCVLGMPITINQNVYFDYLYVNDLVKILKYFIDHKTKYKSYNLGTGKPIDLATIADKVKIIANNKFPIEIKNSGFSNEYTCSNKLLLEEIENFTFSNFDASLRELYKWYLKKSNKLEKETFIKNNYN